MRPVRQPTTGRQLGTHSARIPFNRSLITATALIAVMTLAACGGSGADGSSESSAGGSGADAVSGADEDMAVNGAEPGSSSDRASDRPTPADPDLVIQAPDLIKVGAVALEADDIGDVVDQISVLIIGVDGQIASEETSTDTDGQQSRSRLTLQVPVAKFDATLDKVAGYGDLVSRSSSAKDVTAQVADVNSRTTSAKASIQQLRSLFARATKLGDIITLERELSDREADLEALQAQQRSLASRTSMSTIHVSISLPEEEKQEPTEDQAGFVAGLKSGWNGMVTFVIGSAHAFGLALPLGTLAVVMALIGWIVVRRFTPHRATPTSE
ncbi:MAG: DUF4349 domain-containing protein [Nocardioidaceae bacterium]